MYVVNKVGYVANQLHFAFPSYKMVFHPSIDSQIDSFPNIILYRVIDVLLSKFNFVCLYGPYSV